MQHSEKSYHLLFENNPQPMWIYDLETFAFLAVNNASVHVYGYSREEFLSMTIKDIRPPEDIPVLLDHLSKVPEKGLNSSGIWRHRKSSGEIIDVEIISHNLTLAGKRARLIMAIDVSERIRLEKAIRSAVQEWCSTFDAINDPVILLDKNGIIKRCNKAMAELTGKPFAEIIGRSCREIVHDGSGPIADCPIEAAKETRTRETAIFPSGKQWFEVIVDPLFDDGGDFRGAVHILKDITKQKELEDALKAAVVLAEDEKTRSEGILEAVADGITIQDREFRIIYQNQALKKLIGDHVGEFCYAAYEKREQPCEGCPVVRVFEDGGIHTAERTAPTDKGMLHVENTAAPLRDSTGEIVASIESVREITERKKIEEQLFTATHDWEDTFNSITDMITIHDSDFNIIRANRAAERILGLPFLKNKVKCFEYYHGTGSPPEGCPSCCSIRTGQSTTFEIFEPYLNRCLEVTAIPRKDSNDKIKGLIHIVRDITERKKTDEALSRYSRELTNLNTASNTLMLITNLEDIYQEICNIIFSVFDIEMVWLGLIGADNFVVRPVAHAGREEGYLKGIKVTWDDSAFGMGPTGMSIKTKKICTMNIEDPSFAPWKDEAERRGYFARMSVPLIYARDKCIGALNFYSTDHSYFNPDRVNLCQIFANQAAIAIENATLIESLEISVIERTKELEDANNELLLLNSELELRRTEAESASRSKSDFLANMSHELRTPLNSILGFSDFIQMGMAGPVTDRQKEFLTDIINSGSHLLSLITDILDLSKIEAGKLEIEPETFDLSEFLENSTSMFKEKALKQKIEITSAVDNTITLLHADRRMLKQVMVNLLSNAFKFTDDGGSVRVSARKAHGSQLIVHRKQKTRHDLSAMNYELDRDFVEISVSDTGIGIAEENQQKLFKPFQQIETSLTKKYPGTGLGLSLCRRFIELHGGMIWVESEPGKGSRFVFVIPACQC